jgi:hypothetical protein
MVTITPNPDGITFQPPADSSQVFKKVIFNLIVNPRVTMFGAENNVNINFGERLWHILML